LRGPGGKTVVVADRPAETASGVFEISSRRIEGFQNTQATGEWRVIVRDIYRQDKGSIESVSLELRTR
jgi:subtilisin-like proprotein convertase family protein